MRLAINLLTDEPANPPWAHGGGTRTFPDPHTDLGRRQLIVLEPPRDKTCTAELRALADELGIAADVVWVGEVPLEETATFYRCTDVFAYPSYNETIGLPILEAMASGCPVVTSDVTSMPEVAGGAALLAGPEDEQALADALLNACGPEADRLRAAAGLERAAEFMWARTAERRLEVFREVYAGRNR